MLRVFLAGALALAWLSIADAQTYPSPHFNNVTIDGKVNSLSLPTSNFVGETDTQTLTNKSISGAEINSGAVGTAYGGTGQNWSSSSGIPKIVSGTSTLVAAPTGDLVGTTDAQSLTNKQIDASEITSGVIGYGFLPIGTTANTVAAGNDSRIVGALQTTGGTMTGPIDSNLGAEIPALGVSGNSSDAIYGIDVVNSGNGSATAFNAFANGLSGPNGVGAGQAPDGSGFFYVQGHSYGFDKNGNLTGTTNLATISSLAPIATSGSASDLSTGTVPNARMPVPGASALGGVLSSTAPANQFATGINTSGAVTYAQPSFGNLSGQATLSQLPSIADGHVLANVSGAGAAPQDVSGTSWFDKAYCSTVGYLIVRTTGAWTCSNAYPVNIVWMGADNTGTNDISSVFNAAMTACAAHGSFNNQPNGTIYIPPGRYKVDATLLVAKGCNVKADPSAYIFADASSIVLLSGTYNGDSTSSTLTDQWITGGVWDCNGKAGTSGMYFPYFSHYLGVNHIIMQNCINGEGYIRVGNSTNNADGIYLNNFLFENTLGTTISSNYGFSVAGKSITDSVISNGMIEDTVSPIAMLGFNVHIDQVHVWNFTACIGVGMHFFATGDGSGQDFLYNNVVDGPVCSGSAAYSFDGGSQYIMSGNRYNAVQGFGTPPSNTYGIFVASGVSLTNVGFQLVGNSAAIPIAGDYANAGHSGMVTIGETATNVTSVLGACTSLPTNGICNIE